MLFGIVIYDLYSEHLKVISTFYGFILIYSIIIIIIIVISHHVDMSKNFIDSKIRL